MQRIIIFTIVLICSMPSVTAEGIREPERREYPDPESHGSDVQSHHNPAIDNYLQNGTDISEGHVEITSHNCSNSVSSCNDTVQATDNYLQNGTDISEGYVQSPSHNCSDSVSSCNDTVQATNNYLQNGTDISEGHVEIPSHNFSDSVSSCDDTVQAFQKSAASTNCSVPLRPNNGGLSCAYIDKVYYCKPMCNQGYDFAFLRRSRLYEECGSKTAFKWTTQYIGGSRLAECIASDVIVSGQPLAYFRNETCQDVLSSKEKRKEYIRMFTTELSKRGIKKDHWKDMDFVVCGNC